jgi:transcriptional regulator with XRE-family HTH domain
MIGKKIYEARKLKGLFQEELAEQSKLSVRTLQRIENDASVPR